MLQNTSAHTLRPCSSLCPFIKYTLDRTRPGSTLLADDRFEKYVATGKGVVWDVYALMRELPLERYDRVGLACLAAHDRSNDVHLQTQLFLNTVCPGR